MKGSRLKIIVPSILLFFFILVGGLIYYASTLVTPEEIRKLTITQLQKVLPNSEIDIGEMSVRFGLSTKLDLASLNISSNTPEKWPLFSVENLIVRIPLWSILMGGGTIEVALNGPRFHYAESGDNQNNWSRAMGQSKKATPSPVAKDTSLEREELIIPAFLAHSEIDLRIRDLNLSYELKDQKGELVVSRFIIKNLNFLSASAFEIDSQISLALASGEALSFNTLIIGQVQLNQLLKDEDMSLLAMIKLEKMKIPGLAKEISELKIDVQLAIDPDGEIDGTLKADIMRTSVAMGLNLKDKGIHFKNIALEGFLQDWLDLSGVSVAGLNSSKTKFFLEGGLGIDEAQKIDPDLKFRLEPALVYHLNDVPLNVLSSSSLKGKKIESSSMIDGLGGTLSVRANGELDLNQKDFSLDKLKPFQINIAANNFKMTRSYLQTLIYAPPAPSSTSSNQQEKTQAVSPPLVLPRSTINLSFNQIFIDEHELKGEGKIVVGQDSVVTERLKIQYASGEGNLTHTTKIAKNNTMNNTFHFKMKNLNMAGVDAFLPPFIKGLRGNFNGDFKGRATLKPEDSSLAYNIDLDIKATQGEIVGVDLSEQINAIAERLPILNAVLGEGERAFDFDEKFESLVLKANLTEKKYTLSHYQVKGREGKTELRGDGFISPPITGGASELKMNVTDHKGKVGKELKRSVGSSTLPVRLTGNGYALTPDYEYTLSRVAKSAYETHAKERVNKEVEKQVDKIKEKGIDQLNRLFNRNK